MLRFPFAAIIRIDLTAKIDITKEETLIWENFRFPFLHKLNKVRRRDGGIDTLGSSSRQARALLTSFFFVRSETRIDF